MPDEGMDSSMLNELIALALAGQDQSQGSMFPPEGLSPPEMPTNLLLQMLLGLGGGPGEEMLGPQMPQMPMGMQAPSPPGPPMGMY